MCYTHRATQGQIFLCTTMKRGEADVGSKVDIPYMCQCMLILSKDQMRVDWDMHMDPCCGTHFQPTMQRWRDR